MAQACSWLDPDAFTHHISISPNASCNALRTESNFGFPKRYLAIVELMNTITPKPVNARIALHRLPVIPTFFCTTPRCLALDPNNLRDLHGWKEAMWRPHGTMKRRTQRQGPSCQPLRKPIIRLAWGGSPRWNLHVQCSQFATCVHIFYTRFPQWDFP